MRLHQRAKDPLDNLTIYPWTWNKEVKKDGAQIMWFVAPSRIPIVSIREMKRDKGVYRYTNYVTTQIQLYK